VKTFDASEARNNFGKLIDTAQREPIEIRKKGRAFVVVLAYEDYKKQQADLEKAQDYLLLKEAEEVELEGFIGVDETEMFLEKMKIA
jgi:prevent-host-death family protein